MSETFKLVRLINPISVTVAGTFTPKGAYNGATDYAVGDMVSYQGSSYIMYSDGPAGTLPTNTTYWGLVASKGDTGAAGSIAWKGAYNNATAYVLNDAVSYNGSSYIALQSTTGNLPTNATYWGVLAVKGDPGTAGGVTSVNGYTGVVTLAKGDISLGNVDNTSDANKPVSTATQTALNLKANIASPTFTGTPAAPTATQGNNSTQLATTAYVDAAAAAVEGSDVDSFNGRIGTVVPVSGDYNGSQITNTPTGGISSTDVQAAINELDTEKATLASPTFTGTPSAPTATGGTNTTQLATTAFVTGAISTSGALYVLKAGDTMTGPLAIGAMSTTPLTIANPVFNASGTANAAVQLNIQNQSSGTSASSDVVATANTGSDSANYVNMGINSSTYSDSNYTITGALDSYLYSNGGNLAIGTQSAGKTIVFHTGGTLAANSRMVLGDNGLAVSGFVSAMGAIQNESPTMTAGFYAGLNSTPRIAFATGTNVWEIDNTANVLRFFQPGNVYMQLNAVATLSLGTNGNTPTITQPRNTSSAGNSFVIAPQAAFLGGTDLNGGQLQLNSGIATGGGAGTIALRTSGPTNGVIKTITLSGGGSGYTAGDVLTLTSGGGNATITVNTVSAGVIATFTLTNPGTGYYIGSAQQTSGGTGTGARFSVTALTGTSDNAQQQVMLINNGGANASAINITPVSGTQNSLAITHTVIMQGQDTNVIAIAASTTSAFNAGGLYGYNATISGIPATATSQNFIVAGRVNPKHTGAGTISTMMGMWAPLENNGTGTISQVVGFRSQIFPASATAITTNYNGFEVATPSSANAGHTITSITGVLVNTQSGTITPSSMRGVNIAAQNSTSLTVGLEISAMTSSVTARSIRTSTGIVEFGDNLIFPSSIPSIGLGTSVPTHAITLASTENGIALYNTTDQTTNYERIHQYWNANVYTIATENGGTGTARSILLNGASSQLIVANDGSGSITVSRASTAATIFRVTSTGLTASTGVQAVSVINPIVNQTSGAGYTMLLINPTETAIGSGTKLLADFQVGGSSKASINNNGGLTYVNRYSGLLTRTGALTLAAASPETNLCDATTAPFTLTLPNPTLGVGLTFTIKKTDVSANAVTVASVAGTIDGAATYSLATQYKYVQVTSNGTNWFVIGNN